MAKLSAGSVLFACLSTILPCNAADSQGQSTVSLDQRKGRILAHRTCVICHAIDAETRKKKIFGGAPSFTSIANQSGQTAETVAGKIVLPHPPMPRVQLTRSEIANVARYIMSLKKP